MKVFTHARHELLHAMRQKIFCRAVMLIIFSTFLSTLALAADPVTGKVSDDKGNPLPGVTVQVKGRVGGVTTDVNGKFTIEIPDAAAILVFSYVGFTPQEVNVSGRKSIDIILQPESKALGDVVVVGYGKQKKVNLVGAVSAVNSWPGRYTKLGHGR